MNELEPWAIAALAIVDNDNITPFLLRCYTSSESVVEVMSTLTDMSLDAHLYVGPEDVVRLHLLILSSLDRCDALYEANSEKLRTNQVYGRVNRSRATVTRVDNNQVIKKPETKPVGISINQKSKEINLSRSSSNNNIKANVNLTLPFTQIELGRWVTATTDIRYTGPLQHDERFTAFGFCGANRVKVVLVTVGEEPPSDALVPLCRTIYEHAMWHLCNPFRVFCFSKQNLEKRQVKLLQQETNNIVSTGASKLEKRNFVKNSKVMENVLAIEGMYDDAWSPLNQHLPAAPCIFANLSTSVAFNSQLHSLLSPFTVTSRSVIVDN